MSDGQKAALGLNVRAAPTPIPPPLHPPAVDVVSVVGRTVKFRLHDAANPGRRGKPAKCKGAAIFSYVGPTAPDSPADYRFEGNTNSTTVEIAFPPTVAAGSTVWITAAWFNARTQSGPGSLPISATIQFAPATAAASPMSLAA